jgi:hypothetical protein
MYRADVTRGPRNLFTIASPYLSSDLLFDKANILLSFPGLPSRTNNVKVTAFEQRLLMLPGSQTSLEGTRTKLARINEELQVTSDLFTFVRVQLLSSRQGQLQLKAPPGMTLNVYIDAVDPLPMPQSSPMKIVRIGSEAQSVILPFVGEELSDGGTAGEFLYLGLILGQRDNARRLLQNSSGFVDLELEFVSCEPACANGACIVPPEDTSGVSMRAQGLCKCPKDYSGDACGDIVRGITAQPTPQPDPW